MTVNNYIARRLFDVSCCELCYMTNDRTNENYSGHTLCEKCYKNLKIWKVETLKRYIEKGDQISLMFGENPDENKIEDILLNSNLKHWKRIVFNDIVLDKIAELREKL